MRNLLVRILSFLPTKILVDALRDQKDVMGVHVVFGNEIQAMEVDIYTAQEK
jgi:hypothetical protein